MILVPGTRWSTRPVCATQRLGAVAPVVTLHPRAADRGGLQRAA